MAGQTRALRPAVGTGSSSPRYWGTVPVQDRIPSCPKKEDGLQTAMRVAIPEHSWGGRELPRLCFVSLPLLL